MKHTTLGKCTKLIEFNGDKNKLIFIINKQKTSNKDTYCILWGTNESAESQLGVICLQHPNGRSYSYKKAISEFVTAAKTVDNLIFSKL